LSGNSSRKSEPFIAQTELLYDDGLGDGGALHLMKVNRAKKRLCKFRLNGVTSKLLLVAKNGI